MQGIAEHSGGAAVVRGANVGILSAEFPVDGFFVGGVVVDRARAAGPRIRAAPGNHRDRLRPRCARRRQQKQRQQGCPGWRRSPAPHIHQSSLLPLQQALYQGVGRNPINTEIVNRLEPRLDPLKLRLAQNLITRSASKDAVLLPLWLPLESGTPAGDGY